MDAAALLKSQGWRGKGFSLHPTNNSIGLSRPLLISRNTDGRGVGSKASYHTTSDQWWLRAFDEKLKGLDTSGAKSGTGVVQTVTKGKLDAVMSGTKGGVMGKYTGAAGLYASFVRGGVLEGTLGENKEADSTDATPTSSSSEDGDRTSRKKKNKNREERRSESKAERLARKAARRIRREEREKRKAVEAEAQRRKEEKAAKKAAKKKARSEGETKEERRARRAERRARKEAKRRRREEERKQKADLG
ncbi:hypothetical protein VTJ49DRAFT_3018 [Mycothermus thermophilus]|uniref:G-patch domain-containing protein n=1 Tax=Humicola insolens TaxID=85995 RepID=A0ABR3VAG3_HUMIN